jgi:hypothetical protein
MRLRNLHARRNESGRRQQATAWCEQTIAISQSPPQNGSAHCLSTVFSCDELAALAAKVIVMPLYKSFIF